MFWPLQQLTLAFGTFVSGPRRTNGGLNYPWSPVFVLVMLIGWVALWRCRRDAALFLITPVILRDQLSRRSGCIRSRAA